MGKVKNHYLDLMESLQAVLDRSRHLFNVYYELHHIFQENIHQDVTTVINAAEFEEVLGKESKAFAVWQEHQVGRSHLLQVLQSFLSPDSKILVEQLLTSSNQQDRKLGTLLVKLKEMNSGEH